MSWQVREDRCVSTAGLSYHCLSTPATFQKGEENMCSATVTSRTTHGRSPESIFAQCKAECSIAVFLRKEHPT